MPVIYRAPRKNSLGWRLIAADLKKKEEKKMVGGLVFTRSRVKKKPQWRPITATINKEWEQMKELRRRESSRRKHFTFFSLSLFFLTISAEALGEGGGVGDVIGGVLLWHQGDDGAICYLSISATHTHTEYA